MIFVLTLEIGKLAYFAEKLMESIPRVIQLDDIFI